MKVLVDWCATGAAGSLIYKIYKVCQQLQQMYNHCCCTCGAAPLLLQAASAVSDADCAQARASASGHAGGSRAARLARSLSAHDSPSRHSACSSVRDACHMSNTPSAYHALRYRSL